ncbi:gluconokinase [Streptomyces brasiliensis]|uniref:Gluconokinase n=1 Tax=Streptomyces brasiliensis TaxID=1954 RepID=A0A917KTN3_9ACTN|nr:gluconokinase [Streptomyces brasiliensis]GGJ27330.1 gluconokinase [Streptomyces brasiliensis]
MTRTVGGSRVVIVMGVSAAGKSTVGARLADWLGVPFLEGDDLHPAANRAKMASGRPLDDADREPWLEALIAWIRATAASGNGGVATCSALKREYRDRLRATGADLCFVYLALDPEVAAERIAHRTKHFMPPRLLASQYGVLDPLEPEEPGVTVDASGSEEQVVAAALRAVAGQDR